MIIISISVIPVLLEVGDVTAGIWSLLLPYMLNIIYIIITVWIFNICLISSRNNSVKNKIFTGSCWLSYYFIIIVIYSNKNINNLIKKD